MWDHIRKVSIPSFLGMFIMSERKKNNHKLFVKAEARERLWAYDNDITTNIKIK